MNDWPPIGSYWILDADAYVEIAGPYPTRRDAEQARISLGLPFPAVVGEIVALDQEQEQA